MNGDEEDVGEPIHALFELEQETSPSFLDKIRGRIARRSTASQVLSFSWQAPRTIFFELAGVLMHILKAIAPAGREKR